jgi:hypothetical protein
MPLIVEEVVRVLGEQNPWMETGRVPDALALEVERPLVSGLTAALLRDNPRRYQLVLGPRRVGKTTVMYQTVRRLLAAGVPRQQLAWLRLDHPYLLPIDLGNLVEILISVRDATHDHPLYLFLDELVYAQNWDKWLKTFYDDQWPIKIVSTSSATAALHRRQVESGVGRWEEQFLAPYHLTEYLELAGIGHALETEDDLASTLMRHLRPGAASGGEIAQARRRLTLTGGFPELLVKLEKDRNEEEQVLASQMILKNDAIDRAVYKDIPQSFGVDSPMMLERLLYVLAGQLTGLLSPNTITGELGIAQPTFDRYLSYLESAFLVFTLPNYSGRELSVQKRGRKLYFVDGAVRNAALQRGTRSLQDPVEAGYLLENLVASHLRGLAEQENVRLFHWRQSQNEVDLVYDHPVSPLAIEVATSSSHSRGGFAEFVRAHPRFANRCWLASADAPGIAPGPENQGVGTVPVDLLLMAIGSQMSSALNKRLGAAPDESRAVQPLFAVEGRIL